jgi:hypothetical protein
MLRSKLLTGPAVITWNGGSYFSQGDVVATFASESFDVNVASLGVVSSRQAERMITIEFTPAGEWEADTKTKLFPYASFRIGQSIFGATDQAMVIQPVDGQEILTLGNVGLTRMPSLRFHPLTTLVGPVQFIALGLDDSEWNAANSLFSVANGSVPSFAAFDEAAVLTRGYNGFWTPAGITGFNPFDTEEGFQVDFNMETAAKGTSSVGIIDYRFKNLRLSAKCKPIGPTLAEMLAACKLQGAGAGRGRSYTSVMADLIIKEIDTDSTVFTAKNMSLKSTPEQWGDITNRHGDAEWVSNRKITAGAADPWFVIA